MFSLDSFYKIISKNLLEPINCESHYFKTFGSTDPLDLDCIWEPDVSCVDTNKLLVFYDQEPIYTKQIFQLFGLPTPVGANESWDTICSSYMIATSSCKMLYSKHNFYLLANSEISDEKTKILKDYHLLDWYYFFHGFAALDWYRNIQYLPPIRSYSKLFITFNNLINGKRNYRLNLIAKLMQSNLDQLGYISMNQVDTEKKIKQELFDQNSSLSKEAKYLIFKNLLPNPPTFVIDQKITTGTLSANDDLETLCQGLFHIVTETIFYDRKLHLTEKIFKPIVARRPFFLLAAPYNLQYLKSYGFKTFDRWIDESYDSELDPDKRIHMVVNEIQRLSLLSNLDLDKIYQEMQEVLEYNFAWFFTGFREKISNELVDNFETLLKKYNLNKTKSSDDYLDYSDINFNEVKKRLTLSCC